MVMLKGDIYGEGILNIDILTYASVKTLGRYVD